MSAAKKWIMCLMIINSLPNMLLAMNNVACTNYYETPINITLNYQVGTIIIRPILEISFNLELHAECTGFCHIFAIKDRYPLIYTRNSELLVEYKYSDELRYRYRSTSSEYSLLSNGKAHQLYLKFSQNERVIIIDSTVVHSDDAFYNQSALNQQKNITAVWAGDPNQHVYNGTISDLCIKSLNPTAMPTTSPTNPTFFPTFHPTFFPTLNPTFHPTFFPTLNPTIFPSMFPTFYPTQTPTIIPSNSPTFLPTKTTINPTINPTFSPTMHPSLDPSMNPTLTPTFNEDVVIDTTTTYYVSYTDSNQDNKHNDSFSYELIAIFGVIALLIVNMLIIIVLIICKKRHDQRLTITALEMSNRASNNEKIETSVHMEKDNIAPNTIITSSDSNNMIHFGVHSDKALAKMQQLNFNKLQEIGNGGNNDSDSDMYDNHCENDVRTNNGCTQFGEV